jgi:lycopene cyclase domain-containing protein
MRYAYLSVLLFSLSGLFYLDYEKKLALFWNRKKVLVIIGVTILFFLTWDVTGIVLDVFSTNPAWVSGVYFITPDLPLEEFLFLTLLAYQTILFWRWQMKKTEEAEQ